MKTTLNELELFHAGTKKKKSYKSAGSLYSIESIQKSKEMKLYQTEAMQSLESTLFKLFSASKEPYWLNLILIENCRDLPVHKYSKI